jgi:hypothetical protein
MSRAIWLYVPGAVLDVRHLAAGEPMYRNIAIEKPLMDAIKLLSFLTIRTVDETKIADEVLVLLIPLFRKLFDGVCHDRLPFCC